MQTGKVEAFNVFGFTELMTWNAAIVEYRQFNPVEPRLIARAPNDAVKSDFVASLGFRDITFEGRYLADPFHACLLKLARARTYKWHASIMHF